jgi:type IV pilus assembly protein PilX
MMNMQYYHRQSGVTLVISLIILIALTILGLTTMQSTRTEVSMAGNLREAGITFNAAEAGLSNAESFVNGTSSKGVYTDPDTGLYSKTDEDPDYFNDATWDASHAASTNLPHVVEQPKFVVKYLGDRSQNEAAVLNIGGYGTGQPGKTVSNFRITAKGFGQTNNSVRYVQSYYGKEF